MADEKIISPTIDPPKKEEKLVVDPPKGKTNTEVDELLETLNAVGIENKEQLMNKVNASSETGRMAQLLGEERNTVKELKQRISELETKTLNKPQGEMDLDNYSEGQTIDIESVLGRVLDKRDQKKQQEQHQFQSAIMGKLTAVKSDPDYHLIKDVWEQKEKDPMFMMKVYQGQVDPQREYIETLRGFYKNVMKQSHETITQLRGGELPKPPHVETGERTSTNIVSTTDTDDEKAKKIKGIRDKVDKGELLGEEAELAIVDLL